MSIVGCETNHSHKEAFQHQPGVQSARYGDESNHRPAEAGEAPEDVRRASSAGWMPPGGHDQATERQEPTYPSSGTCNVERLNQRAQRG